MSFSPILGIDYGTTNTAAAWCDDQGKVHLVPVGEKCFTLPSIVWFRSRDKSVAGEGARSQLIDDPAHTVFASKRFVGRLFRSEFVTQHKDRFLYPVEADDGGTAVTNIYDQRTTFTEVTFIIINRIRELAVADSGHDFDQAVLTVPAHFNFRQRGAIRTAAEMAGLDVVAMVNEPTAAALYYGLHYKRVGRVLVFDLGGGTLDATVLELSNRQVTVLASGGDPFLGGHDFDTAIMDHLVGRLPTAQQELVRRNPVTQQRIRFAAERAKVALSRASVVEVKVPFVAQEPDGSFVDLDCALTREQLESATEGLVARCVGLVEDTLAKAKLGPIDIAELVFVGGQTRMPAVRERLARQYATDSKKNIHPDLGVAVGAAILGRTMRLPRGSGLVDVMPVPIGLMMPGAGSVEVIHQNSPLPCTERVPITRPSPGEPWVAAVYEAFDMAGVDRDLLGTLRIEPEIFARTEGPLELEMRVGQDFDLTVALVPTKGEGARIEMQPIKP